MTLPQPMPSRANPARHPPSVNCDLCGFNMPLPTICQERGEVLGLLVCTACTEDQLEALNYERTCEAH